jgi:dolichol-phosphate mannosyltransferase
MTPTAPGPGSPGAAAALPSPGRDPLPTTKESAGTAANHGASGPAPPATARVAAVIPAYKEMGKIGEVVRKIPRAHVAWVIVVDDASGDGTAQEAREAGADVVITHPRNRGVGAGIRTGLARARELGATHAVILSGDDQHEPDELPRVLRPLLAGECDLVQGSRWLPGGSTPGIPPSRRWLTRLYPLLFRLFSGHPVTDGTNGFRAFRLDLLDHPLIRLDQEWLDTYELEPYLLMGAFRAGFRVKEEPVTVRYHGRGTTKMKFFRDGWRILRPLILIKLGLKH